LSVSFTVFIFTACSSKLKVESQSISVSSDPVGAAVYADGTFQGNTPTTVSLSKDRQHIITVTKEGHEVCMIPVHVINDDLKNVREAVLDGVHDGLFFKDPLSAVSSARVKLEQEEKSGKNARLEPGIVCLKLVEKQS